MDLNKKQLKSDKWDPVEQAKRDKQKKLALVLDLVKFVFEIMQTVAFMMFIQEEALQIRGFGIITLIREGLVEEVKTQREQFLVAASNLETFCSSWGYLAPYVRGTYLNYAQSSFDQADAWQAWIDEKEKEDLKKTGIRIVSSPANANIIIDGVDTVKITPQTFDLTEEGSFVLTEGEHTFKLTYRSTRRGYLTYEETVVIETGKVKEYRWLLEEA